MYLRKQEKILQIHKRKERRKNIYRKCIKKILVKSFQLKLDLSVMKENNNFVKDDRENFPEVYFYLTTKTTMDLTGTSSKNKKNQQKKFDEFRS